MVSDIISILLLKVSDGVISKLGEDLWELLKKPFENKGIKDFDKIGEEKLRKVLFEILEEDSVLKRKLELLFKSNTSNFVQNINNAGATIEKQVNISNINGTINL